jgi:hypothetical protein
MRSNTTKYNQIQQNTTKYNKIQLGQIAVSLSLQVVLLSPCYVYLVMVCKHATRRLQMLIRCISSNRVFDCFKYVHVDRVSPC